jgi:hypothetical protein
MDLTSLNEIRANVIGHPLISAALAGFYGAIVVDLAAFAATKDPGGWFEGFKLKVAAMRWLQGLIGGFLGTVLVGGGTDVVTLWFASW